MELDDDEFHAQLRKEHRKDCRAPEWTPYVSEMCVKRGHRCAICGKRDGCLTVHHKYYERGLRLWEYPDDGVEVVHQGRCHRKADREREEQNQRDRICKEFGPEALKELPPTETEWRELAQHDTRFKQWLIDKRLGEDWDWNNKMWPLWRLWKEFAEEFRREAKAPCDEVQLGLGL